MRRAITWYGPVQAQSIMLASRPGEEGRGSGRFGKGVAVWFERNGGKKQGI